MTLITCLRSKNGIVLAGDKRSILGQDLLHRKDDGIEKVYKINNKVAIGAGGNGNDASHILEQVMNSDLKGDVDKIAGEVSDIVSDYHKQFKTQEFQEKIQNNTAHEPNYSFMVAGYTDDKKQRVYTISSSNTRKKPEGIRLSMGISLIADLFFIVHDQEKSIEEMKELTKQAMNATSKVSWGISPEYDTIVLKDPS